MSQLTLDLPDTLYAQVRSLAERENTSLNQYVVYVLTRQVAQAYDIYQISDYIVQQQKVAYDSLLGSLGHASFDEIKQILDEREDVEPEIDLNPQVVKKLQKHIAESHAS